MMVIVVVVMMVVMTVRDGSVVMCIHVIACRD